MDLAAGASVAVDIEKPAAGGAMVARYQGRVLLVHGAIPGEHVIVQVDRVSKGVAFAHTTAVERPSEDRRDPFTDPLCGGCLYAHVAYERQLDLKSQIITDAMSRIGR